LPVFCHSQTLFQGQSLAARGIILRIPCVHDEYLNVARISPFSVFLPIPPLPDEHFFPLFPRCETFLENLWWVFFSTILPPRFFFPDVPIRILSSPCFSKTGFFFLSGYQPLLVGPPIPQASSPSSSRKRVFQHRPCPFFAFFFAGLFPAFFPPVRGCPPLFRQACYGTVLQIRGWAPPRRSPGLPANSSRPGNFSFHPLFGYLRTPLSARTPPPSLLVRPDASVNFHPPVFSATRPSVGPPFFNCFLDLSFVNTLFLFLFPPYAVLFWLGPFFFFPPP